MATEREKFVTELRIAKCRPARGGGKTRRPGGASPASTKEFVRYGLGNEVQVLPPSVVLYVVFVEATLMMACWASIAKTEVTSLVVGEETFSH